jgi:hypothetical protein
LKVKSFEFKSCQGELVGPGVIRNKLSFELTRLRQAQADNIDFESLKLRT